MSTAQQVIDSIKSRRWPSLTNSAGLIYVNYVQAQILMAIPLLRQYTDSAPLTFNTANGTKEYTLQSATVRANQVACVLVNGNMVDPTTQEEQIRGASTDLHTAASGTPTKFYITSDDTGILIGFQPTPNAVLPVKVYGSSIKPLASGDNVIPGLPSEEIFDHGISYYFKMDLEDPDASAYWALFQAEIKKLQVWAETLNEGFQDGARRNARS